MANRVDENHRVRSLQSARRAGEQQLQEKGFLSYQNKLTQELYKTYQPTVYDDWSKPKQTVSNFTPIKTTKLPEHWIDDFYSHTLDISKNRFAYVASETGRIYIDFLHNMGLGTWNRPQSILFPENDMERLANVSFYDGHPNKMLLNNGKQAYLMDFVQESILRGFDFQEPQIRTVASEGQTIHVGKTQIYMSLDPRIPKAKTFTYKTNDVIKIISNFPYLVLGENSNTIEVFDLRKQNSPLHIHKEHTAGIRALCWDQTPGYFYSGGGTTDRQIIYRSVQSEKPKWTFKSEAQVLDLYSLDNQLISVHGYAPELTENRAHNIAHLWSKCEKGLRLKENLPFSEDINYRPLFTAVKENHFYAAYSEIQSTELYAFRIENRNEKLNHTPFSSIR